ncbi:hypothetical protein GK3052 [Geobacillus kaustophilus HTA426]|uniref:Uncharacterized protein n=1 Tax=Geobacillus kaustophilus (strain HTA426) TaxID=235909 RepID=Q5KVE9_GEOKA|nr:hypothetical protein GA8_03815 [Geobacillus sp. A8]BAD77337.1 hypothetical protein GK3052 [Geobacillus kaustophilus HTA426]
MNQASANDVVNAVLIQAVETTSQRIVIQQGRMEPGMDGVLQVNRVTPIVPRERGFK